MAWLVGYFLLLFKLRLFPLIRGWCFRVETLSKPHYLVSSRCGNLPVTEVTIYYASRNKYVTVSTWEYPHPTKNVFPLWCLLIFNGVAWGGGGGWGQDLCRCFINLMFQVKFRKLTECRVVWGLVILGPGDNLTTSPTSYWMRCCSNMALPRYNLSLSHPSYGFHQRVNIRGMRASILNVTGRRSYALVKLHIQNL